MSRVGRLCGLWRKSSRILARRKPFTPAWQDLQRKPVSAHRPSICQAIAELFLMTQNSMAKLIHAGATYPSTRARCGCWVWTTRTCRRPTGGDLYVSWDGSHRLDQLLLENWRLAERRSALFVRHFQKKQIRQLLDVIAIRQPVIPQDVAAVPELLDNLMRTHFTGTSGSKVLSANFPNSGGSCRFGLNLTVSILVGVLGASVLNAPKL